MAACSMVTIAPRNSAFVSDTARPSSSQLVKSSPSVAYAESAPTAAPYASTSSLSTDSRKTTHPSNRSPKLPPGAAAPDRTLHQTSGSPENSPRASRRSEIRADSLAARQLHPLKKRIPPAASRKLTAVQHHIRKVCTLPTAAGQTAALQPHTAQPQPYIPCAGQVRSADASPFHGHLFARGAAYSASASCTDASAAGRCALMLCRAA